MAPRIPRVFPLVVGLAIACGASQSPAPALAPPADPVDAAAAPAPVDAAVAIAPEPAPVEDAAAAGARTARASLLAYAKAHLPEGGDAKIENGELVLTHHVKKNASESATAIAGAWLGLTDIYAKEDLAKAIAKANPKLRTAAAGDEVTIPSPIASTPKSADEERIGWPEDKVIRGIYMHDDGYYGGKNWIPTLERMKARGMNAVVLDFKDYDGRFTYDTKIPLALETKASIHHLPDMERTIRFAHKYGIRILARIACFHDPWTAPKKTELSIMGNWGGPFPAGWLDPGGDKSHAYILDIVKEALSYGIDEVQLDYIRYPVHAGMAKADYKLGKKTKIEAIDGFVKEVHAVTAEKHVPLSLDVFGVTAMNYRPDIEALGQDMSVLAADCEALSPMVYPSHYDKGFMGFDEPGNHPEIIAVGVKGSLAQIEAGHIEHPAVVRPWLQAFMWRSPEFGPNYLREETKQAETSGGVGWLMWNPGQAYPEAWRGMPVLDDSGKPATAAKAKPRDAAPATAVTPKAKTGSNARATK